MRIYIAGPMTGLPVYNLPAFAAAAFALARHGYCAVNPGRHGVIEGYTWHDYMRRGFRELLDCEAVALLDGWEASRGAQAEVNLARILDMPVKPLAAWLRKAS